MGIADIHTANNIARKLTKPQDSYAFFAHKTFAGGLFPRRLQHEQGMMDEVVYAAGRMAGSSFAPFTGVIVTDKPLTLRQDVARGFMGWALNQ